MKFYQSTNRYSEIKEQSWMKEQLKLDHPFLFQVVKSILIHPMDAKKVKYDRKNRGIFHCENSTVEKMLTYSRLEPFLKKRKLPLPTTANDRAVLSCDHHALLFAALLRSMNIPVRVRTGYSKYLVEGWIIPHWITEVYDVFYGTWNLVDPERGYEKVKREEFLFSAEVWKDHMETGKEYSSYSGLSGTQGLKYALLCDLNCIFKNELLSYEWRLKAHNRKKPQLVRTSYFRLNQEEKSQIDEIGILLLSPDENRDRLWELYKKIVEEVDLQESGYEEWRKEKVRDAGKLEKMRVWEEGYE